MMRKQGCSLRKRICGFGLVLVAIIGLASWFGDACSDDTEMILATSTSTENSGLLAVLVPLFEDQSGYSVKVIAVGSGAAMKMGERGDADVLLVHSPAAETVFIEAGFGIERTPVMFNDFVIVGPLADPAAIKGAPNVTAALSKIHDARAAFISRGDESGTHKRELILWEDVRQDVDFTGDWYAETGQGMGATLTIAAATDAYTLTDRGTWLAVSDRNEQSINFEGGDELLNEYHVIVVAPERHNRLNVEAARSFRGFLIAPKTQEIISSFGREEYGQSMFTAYAE